MEKAHRVLFSFKCRQSSKVVIITKLHYFQRKEVFLKKTGNQKEEAVVQNHKIQIFRNLSASNLKLQKEMREIT